MTLDWSAYPCTEANFAYYEILFDAVHFTDTAAYSWDWSEDGALSNIGTTSTTVLLPGPDIGYVFRIRAWDTFGNAGPLSDWCAIGAYGSLPDPIVDFPGFWASACTPNPFNPSTAIQLTLDRDADVRAEIFDARGQRIRLLLQEKLTTGSHRLVWDGRGDRGELMASGFYLCRITGNGEILNRKMTLLK